MAPQGPELAHVLSLLSHELRSPLGVVRGYLRLLNQHQSELSEQHLQAVQAALRASDRCVDLLAQASALAQMWRNETPIGRQRVPVIDILEPLGREARTSDDRPVPVEIGPVAGLSVTGDRALLLTALSSLVTAVHRAQPDEVTVHVTSRTLSNWGRDGIAIQIAPQGRSLDAASEVPLGLRRGGLGLDLPMAAAIVEAHDGNLAERRVDSRMAMVVWLPLSNADRRPQSEERDDRT